jgi:serine/threonine protein phosphatase PrpC
MRAQRALGDFKYKQRLDGSAPGPTAVSVEAVLSVHARGPDDALLVLACDGVWDVFSDQSVAEFFERQLLVRAVVVDPWYSPPLPRTPQQTDVIA